MWDRLIDCEIWINEREFICGFFNLLLEDRFGRLFFYEFDYLDWVRSKSSLVRKVKSIENASNFYGLKRGERGCLIIGLERGYNLWKRLAKLRGLVSE